MSKRKPLTVIGVLVTKENKDREIQRLWNEISEEEKNELRIKLTDNAMAAAGYVRCSSKKLEILHK